MQSTERDENIHMGRNVKRFREWKNISQEDLAFELNVTQQSVSLIEQKETIDDGLLEQISKVLKVPVEAIKNFDPEQAICNIQNNYDSAQGAINAYHCTFNPLDKYVEQVEENRKLYERLLASEREKVELLQRVLDERK